VERTRTLEGPKLDLYVAYLRDMSAKKVINLHELQVLVGRMYRASLTMPFGSKVFLAELLRLTRGLKMPWHRRRMTALARSDIAALIEILTANHGRGYFDTGHLPVAPGIYTDAMKNDARAGWGWCSECGRHDAGVYGRSQRRKPIDELEGDAVLRAVNALGPSLRGMRVPVYIDNSAFQLSFTKGWSKAVRLTKIVKKLYLASASFGCVFSPVWISTHDNVGADALSRGDPPTYSQWAQQFSHSGERV